MSQICETLTVLDLVPFGQTGREMQFFALRLSRPGWENWHPGQFVMLRPRSFGGLHLWGRPFSISHMTSRFLACFFKVQGEGTRLMSLLKPGDKVESWGPLGTYFATENEKPVLLLAGGMGIAPFVGYVNNFAASSDISMVFGHKEPLDCYPVDSLADRIPVRSFREQSPADLTEFISILEKEITKCAHHDGLALACGPRPFLKTVQTLAKKSHACAQLSLENRMACGVGACLGCVCKSSSEWPEQTRNNWPVRVCVEGPVFWANTIELQNS